MATNNLRVISDEVNAAVADQRRVVQRLEDLAARIDSLTSGAPHLAKPLARMARTTLDTLEGSAEYIQALADLAGSDEPAPAPPVVGEHMSDEEYADKLGVPVKMVRDSRRRDPAPDWTQYHHACPECHASEEDSAYGGDGFRRCRKCGTQWNVTDTSSWTTHRLTGKPYEPPTEDDTIDF